MKMLISLIAVCLMVAVEGSFSTHNHMEYSPYGYPMMVVIPKAMLCTETTTTTDHFLPATTDFTTTDPTTMVHTTWLLTTDSSPTWDLTTRLSVLVLDV